MNDAPTTETTSRRPRVVVVDDDEATRELVGELLTHAGYAVATVRTGDGALELLRHVRPDVIVLDLRLPVMDGESFLERYRRDSGLAPAVILLSADLRLEQDAARLGASAYVQKPFDLDELKSAIERSLVPA